MTRTALSELFPLGDPFPGENRGTWNGAGRRLFDPISAGIGLVGSIAGGLIQSNAATKSAGILAQGAKAAGQYAQQGANEAAGDIASAVPVANTAVVNAQGQANDTLTRANQGNLDRNANALAAGNQATTDLSTLSQAPGFTWNAAQDPGYQFRMNEATKAIQNSGAARGAATGGAAMKALTRYSSDYASSEYQNAFSRFQTDRTNKAALLTPLINAGTTAAGQDQQSSNYTAGTQSGNDMQAGQFVGANTMAGTTAAADLKFQGAKAWADALSGQANANAAGTVGSANAWSNAFGGGSNAVMNATLLKMLSGNKAAGGGGGFSDTSSTTSGLPTDGNFGDWAGEYTG